MSAVAEGSSIQEVEFEVVDRFVAADHADHLLYAPLGRDAEVRRSRIYRFRVSAPEGGNGEGAREALDGYVRCVLVDAVAQELHVHPAIPFEGWQFCLERSIKPGTLDLEREAVLAYDRGANHPAFAIRELRLAERFYIFDAGNKDAVPEAPFVRDLVNDAVQNFQLIRG